jgi:riboflavin synthase
VLHWTQGLALLSHRLAYDHQISDETYQNQRGQSLFTGIISDIGELVRRDGGRYTIRASYAAASIDIGASIACSGCCLTVVSKNQTATGVTFDVDVSNETLSKTTLGRWQPGQSINLERALKVGDELGGHSVTGHIDGLATVTSMTTDGDSRRFEFEAPAALSRFIAAKGSVALDGTSLTVNSVAGHSFCVNLIPHTLTVTTWGRTKPGDQINLEIDLIARYVARLMEHAP